MSENKTQRIDRSVAIAWGIIAFSILAFIAWQNEKPDGVTALYTILLVMVGAGQLGLFWWQLRLINQSLADTKLAAIAANKSADSAITAQRPWIKIDLERLGPLEKMGDGVRTQFNVVLKNIGNSPATNVQTWIYMGCAGSLSRTGLARALCKTQPYDHNIGHSLFPMDVEKQPTWGSIFGEEIKEAFSEAQIVGRISILVVVHTRYKFIGGMGETQSVYTIHNNEMFDTINLHYLPIEPFLLNIHKEAWLDTVK